MFDFWFGTNSTHLQLKVVDKKTIFPKTLKPKTRQYPKKKKQPKIKLFENIESFMLSSGLLATAKTFPLDAKHTITIHFSAETTTQSVNEWIGMVE